MTGFFSKNNIDDLYISHFKFLAGVRLGLKFVEKGIDEVRATIQNWPNYNSQYNVYASALPLKWQLTRYKGDTVYEEHRAYLHIYYSKEKEGEQLYKFNQRLTELKKALENGERNSVNEGEYAKYFEISSTPKRGITVTAKQDAINEAIKNFGYFALLSNEIKDSAVALMLYRNKDVIEKAFGNIKERLNSRRMEVSSELSLDGKLFVEFIALIYLSYSTFAEVNL